MDICKSFYDKGLTEGDFVDLCNITDVEMKDGLSMYTHINTDVRMVPVFVKSSLTLPQFAKKTSKAIAQTKDDTGKCKGHCKPYTTVIGKLSAFEG